jgi:hypothetical protein
MTETFKRLKCEYPTPCSMIDGHTLPNGTRKGGIVALDNRVWLGDPSRYFHMGFALKPSPHPEVGKQGVMFNFCPFCGANLNDWLRSYEADMAAFKDAGAQAVEVQP